jgi:PAS domain S-box-containing protein
MHAGATLEPTDLGNRLPSRLQKRLVAAALAAGAAVFALLLTIAQQPVSEAVGIVTMYGAGLTITQLLTALLLVGQRQMRRTAGLGLLAFGYLLSAVCACVYILLFPGVLSVFAPSNGALAGDWLYLGWHGAFALCVLGYAIMSGWRRWRLRDALALGGLLLLGALAVWLDAGGWLPSQAADEGLPAHFETVLDAVVALSLLAFAGVLYRRPRMLLDLWLSVAMAAWLFDLALSASFTTQAFDLGFYGGRLGSLFGSLCLLVVLAFDNIAMNGRLRATFEQMIEARAREKSNELLAAVLRQLPEGVFILDGDANRLIVNERGASMARQGPAVSSGSVMAMVSDQASRAAGGEAFEDEIMENVAGGERRVFSVSGAPVRDADGAVAATVVVVNDVTERTEADRALRRALDQTRALLENTPLAAVEWGPDRVVRMWSHRAEQLFGWSALEAVGCRIDTLGIVHPEDGPAVDGLLKELLRGGDYVRGENRNLTRDGRMLLCEWHNSVLRNERGEIETVFSLALDVTERRQAMDQLREADLRKDLFIATLAHELRNPLAPISNAASLLLTQNLPPERIEWMSAMISRQSGRMARLLDDLLDVSRISRGKIELRREPLDLCALAHEALQTSMPLIEAGRHRIDLALPDTPVWVDADPVRIAQVMSNLLNNAAKYTPPGGRIEVRLGVDGGSAVFSVLDNGIGIEPEMLGQVFEAFVQVGSARHLAQGGLGIGLSLARGLVELHGGSLNAESAGRDQGSTFSMRLPVGSRPARARHDPALDGAASVLDASILIADDNVDAAESLALLLRARGARVTVAHDGEQALRLFRDQPADIAILDLGMPRVDGLEVARQLSQAHPRPYLAALTGRGRKEDRADSLRAGFDEHLTKPVDPRWLVERLRRVQAQRTLRAARDGAVPAE